MGTAWTSLVVAVVGVAGTLVASLLTQRRADRTKRLELAALAEERERERHHGERLRHADLAEARAQASLALRRTCYVSLNTACRQYLTAQVNYLKALRAGDPEAGRACLALLEERRTAHRDSYAEAQMVVPGEVLDAARAANRLLNDSYGALLRSGGDLTDGDTARLRRGLDSGWNALTVLRRRMRNDLGLDP
ncbi:hypothetical protein [Streptomyces aidingensis]|uniref:Uncharacterized protein n=1 Tax=Streptomyces aidingensis TaxID=910347 RepID=A0A1I1R6L1_9ACTN|nr:hypothetical protein [Streptomyces aidingensis]SFD25940.1 hypothetical protein SAMN05421773_11222 [Streptomyces aidingensis]